MELLPFDRLVGLWCDMALASLSPDADAWNDPFACIAVVGHESHLPMCVCVTDATRRRRPAA
jgi:phthiodiolone/phenolphthiodiolone dimycocerosates ketoreductase